MQKFSRHCAKIQSPRRPGDCDLCSLKRQVKSGVPKYNSQQYKTNLYDRYTLDWKKKTFFLSDKDTSVASYNNHTLNAGLLIWHCPIAVFTGMKYHLYFLAHAIKLHFNPLPLFSMCLMLPFHIYGQISNPVCDTFLPWET